MKKIVLLSECIGVKNSEIYIYKFHFKGVYLGEKVNSIYVYSQIYCEIFPGCEYLLSINKVEINKGVIKSVLVSFKDLDHLNLF